MRLLITIAVVSLALCCHARPADDDYVYEDDAPAEPSPAPAPKPTPRHALVNSRTARGPSPLIGSRGVKTTTAPPKPAEPEVVNEPEAVDEEAGGDIEDAPAVTTEAPKKGLSRGGVRPFRSNQDLLAALKRKRQQEHWRVVYEYLYVRFGYPVNLHHKLDLSPDLETGGVNDPRSEINEVTSGDNDPPPKLKPGGHELVTEKIAFPDHSFKVNPVTDNLVKNGNIQREYVSDEPVKIELIKVERVRDENVKVDPAEVGQVKVEGIRIVEVTANPKQIDQFKVEKVRDEPVKVEVRAGPVKVEQSKLESNRIEVKVEPVRLEPVKRETIKFNLPKVEPVRVEEVRVEPAEPETVNAAESMKIETFRPVEAQNPTSSVKQLIGTTVFTSASYSVSYS